MLDDQENGPMNSTTSPAPNRWVEIEQIGAVSVVTFKSDMIVRETMIRELGEELTRLVTPPGSHHFVLHFGKVTRLSSLMLAKLIVFHQQVAAAGGRLALCMVRPDVQELFEITQTTKLFPIYETEQEALQSF